MKRIGSVFRELASLGARSASRQRVLCATLAINALSCALGVSFDSYSVHHDAQSVRLYGASGAVEGLGATPPPSATASASASGSAAPPPAAPERVSLYFNGEPLLDVGNGPFFFQPTVADGVAWRLSVGGAPCAISPSTGIIASHDVTGVAIRCSSDATLERLSLSEALSPPLDFSAAVHTYAGSLDTSAQGTGSGVPIELSLWAVVHHAGASVTVNGRPVDKDGKASVQLSRGHQQFDVLVTSENLSSMQYYTVAVNVL